MLKPRRNARCTAVVDSVLMNSRTQKILCFIVAILLSTDAAARLCARRTLQRWYLKIQNVLFQMLCRSFTYYVQFRKYRRTELSPTFLITLYKLDSCQQHTLHSLYIQYSLFLSCRREMEFTFIITSQKFSKFYSFNQQCLIARCVCSLVLPRSKD